MTREEFLKEVARAEEIQGSIREEFPTVEFPNVYSEPVWYGRTADGISKVDGRMAVIGEFKGDRYVYAIPSEQYKILPHEEVIHNLKTRLATLQEYGEPAIKVSLLNNGAYMRVNVQFPMVNMEVKPGDKMRPAVDVYNSYDLSRELELTWGAYQLICSNGAVAFRVQERISGKHRLNLNLGHNLDRITEGLESYSEQIGIWRAWATKQLEGPEWTKLWDALPFGGDHRKKLLELKQAGTNHTLQEYIDKGSVN